MDERCAHQHEDWKEYGSSYFNNHRMFSALLKTGTELMLGSNQTLEREERTALGYPFFLSSEVRPPYFSNLVILPSYRLVSVVKRFFRALAIRNHRGMKLISTIVFVLIWGSISPIHAKEPTRPNILFIMVDDLGYGDLSCYGHPSIRTPNIDALAACGTRFTQAYAGSPICTPSRTAFMTGRYPARTHVGLLEPIDFGDTSVGFTPEIPSIAVELKKRGYKTILVGKWHLGYGARYSPRVNGFDEFYGYNGGGIDYVSHTDPSGNLDLFRNEQAQNTDGYLTDLFGTYAVEFLREAHLEPFFLSLQFNAPHWPWQAPGASPYPLGDKEWKQWGSKDVYRQMVESLDAAVGRIMATLREQKLDRNTLVVVTSDNGGERYSDMHGLKGRKFLLWEGGIRVPSIAVWPGKVRAGIVSCQPIIHMDWTATFLTLAGAQPDPMFPLDGVNLMPLLQDPAKHLSRTFYWRVSQRNQQKAIRDGNWKYLKTEDDEHLFNLSTDSCEAIDLKAKYMAKFDELKAKYAEWEQGVLAPIPLNLFSQRGGAQESGGTASTEHVMVHSSRDEGGDDGIRLRTNQESH
jgi:arylsulfatase A-like enzyme